jgi:hypothetical protein
VEKEEFKREVQNQLGLAPGQDCDTICGAMGDEEFKEFCRIRQGDTVKKKAKIHARRSAACIGLCLTV